MPRRKNRFQEKPIDRFVRIVQRGEVDFAVPPSKQLMVRHQLPGEIVGEKQPYLRCPSDQARAEITSGHLIRVSEGIQSFR